MADETETTAPDTTMLVRFLRTHPAFGHFAGSVGEVLIHVGQQLIADGFAEPATPAPETAIVPADPAPSLPADETSTLPTDETR